MPDIHLRNATDSDENLLFKWRNINELVALSSYQNKVTLDEHKKWFRNKLKSSNCELFIIQLNDQDIGLIRIDIRQKDCEVTIYLIPGNEGMGFGYKSLSQALKSIKTKCSTFIAKVQVKNIPSQKLFIKLDFKEISRGSKIILYQKITT